MPTYKSLPTTKKTEELPLYRPVDGLVEKIWEKKELLVPFVIVAFIALLGFVGFKSYAAHYESRASDLYAQGKLEETIQQYGRSEAARLASLKLGKQTLDDKDYDKAAQRYGAVADDQAAAPILRVAAGQNLALVYLKKGDAAKAVSLLQRLSKDGFNQTPDYTQLLLARATEVSGDVAGAKDLYKSLSEGASDASIKDEAKERLSWIDKDVNKSK